MGEIIGFILSALSGVVGNGMYSILTKDQLESKLTLIYHDAEDIFYKKYGNKYGDNSVSFLSRQENIDYIIKSFGYEEKEELNYKGFNVNSYENNIMLANKEDIDDFIQILKHEIVKDQQLGLLLQQKEHIIEQNKMNSKIIEMSNTIKESNQLINRLLLNNAKDVTINFDEIMDIYNEEDPNEQDFKLLKWLNNNNGHKEGIVLKANIAYKQENWSLAYKLYKFIVDKYDEEFELNNTLGLICVNIGEFKKAEEFYNLVLKKDDKNLNVLFNLGSLYKEIYNDNNKALKYLLRAENSAPEDSEVLNNIGVIYKEEGDYEVAERYFKLAIKSSKDNPLPFLNMGELNMDIYYNYDVAVSYFEKYLEFENGEKDKIYNLLGLIYGSIVFKDREKSIHYFGQALKFNPSLIEAENNLEIIKFTDGFFDSFMALSGDKFIDLYEQGYLQ